MHLINPIFTAFPVARVLPLETRCNRCQASREQPCSLAMARASRTTDPTQCVLVLRCRHGSLCRIHHALELCTVCSLRKFEQMLSNFELSFGDPLCCCLFDPFHAKLWVSFLLTSANPHVSPVITTPTAFRSTARHISSEHIRRLVPGQWHQAERECCPEHLYVLS